jgi:hypothetical protein
MRRSTGCSLLIATVLGVLGCGGTEEVTPQFRIEMGSQRLLSEAALLAIYFYGAEQSCGGVRATTPRPTSVLGPFRADLTDAGRTAGIVFRQDAVPVGTYLIFVDALDANGALVGTGCSPNQQVLNQQVAAIQVTVQDT